jgi:hypothetical protein
MNKEGAMNSDGDGRMGFDEALAHAASGAGAAFAVTPVFGDDGDEQATAEGARVFVLLRDDDGVVRLRFVAGPFFSSAYAANEVVEIEETPDSVRQLRFMATHCEVGWFSEQVQVLVNRLVDASGARTTQMPNYEQGVRRAAGPDVVFPVSFVGKPR